MCSRNQSLFRSTIDSYTTFPHPAHDLIADGNLTRRLEYDQHWSLTSLNTIQTNSPDIPMAKRPPSCQELKKRLVYSEIQTSAMFIYVLTTTFEADQPNAVRLQRSMLSEPATNVVAQYQGGIDHWNTHRLFACSRRWSKYLGVLFQYVLRFQISSHSRADPKLRYDEWYSETLFCEWMRRQLSLSVCLH